MTNTAKTKEYPILPELKDLPLLEKILNGIWSGELKHEQKMYFCNSAKCVAGWIVSHDYPEYDFEALDYMGFDEASRTVSQEIVDVMKDYSAYASKRIGLTHAEGCLLFDPDCTKTLHQKVLSALKQGKRLWIDPCVSIVISSEEGYKEVVEINADSKLEEDKIKEFLDTEELIF